MTINCVCSIQRLISIGWISLLYIVIISVLSTVECYRSGDAIETDVIINGKKHSNPARHLVPKFGLKWENEVKFEKVNLLGRRDYDAESTNVNTFALQFEDGTWTLPTLPLIKERYGKQRFLESFTVQFTKSKSGFGIIHLVEVIDIKYTAEDKPFVLVKYEWIDDIAVSPDTGYIVMFVSILLFVIYFFCLCDSVLSNDDPHTQAVPTSKNI